MDQPVNQIPPPAPRLRAGAIVTGAAVDIGCTFLGIIALMVYHGIRLAEQGVPQEQAAQQFTVLLGGWQIHVHAWFCTVLGGFITGWIAKERHLQHALWMGVLSTVLGLLSFLPGGAQAPIMPAWFTVLSFLAVVPLALIGGFMSKLLSR
jgi:hypothetical protein